MAAPIPDHIFVGLFRAEGITQIFEHPGWPSHNRGNRGTGWGPINGVINHHTGSDTSGNGTAYNNAVLWPGYASLPGPLCQLGVGPDGTLHINSNGRANHAGLGARQVLNDVIDEAAWLMRREAKPRTRETDGNSRFYGIEIMYSGSHAMTAQQWDTVVRANAAIERYYRWSARSSIAHREWSTTKWDPGHCDMVTLRNAIQRQLAHTPAAGGAGGFGGGGPAPITETKEWYEMSTLSSGVAGAIEKIGRKIADSFLTGIPGPTRWGGKKIGLWLYLKNTNDRAFNGGKYAWQARQAAVSAAADSAAVRKMFETFLRNAGKPLTEAQIEQAAKDGTAEAITQMAQADATYNVSFSAPPDAAEDTPEDEEEPK